MKILSNKAFLGLIAINARAAEADLYASALRAQRAAEIEWAAGLERRRTEALAIAAANTWEASGRNGTANRPVYVDLATHEGRRRWARAVVAAFAAGSQWRVPCAADVFEASGRGV
jgi:hypothetical protein